MVEQKILDQISNNFDFLKNHLQGIMLFGSYADDSHTHRSDIDVCLIAGREDIKEIFNMVIESNVTQTYDVKIFETLPLYIKAEILEYAIPVWAHDEAELSYYLYKWRRLVEDQFYIRQKLATHI